MATDGPLRIKGKRLKKLVGAFGLELDQDNSDIYVGRVVLVVPNGRYIVTARSVDAKGHLHMTLNRDQSTRSQRKKTGIK
jgi:hypothetical protein